MPGRPAAIGEVVVHGMHPAVGHVDLSHGNAPGAGLDIPSPPPDAGLAPLHTSMTGRLLPLRRTRYVHRTRTEQQT